MRIERKQRHLSRLLRLRHEMSTDVHPHTLPLQIEGQVSCSQLMTSPRPLGIAGILKVKRWTRLSPGARET